jgi:hypothetical protein
LGAWRKACDRVFQEDSTRRIEWTPHPGPQALAYDCTADELYYGGAAGGGKTFLLCGAALTRHQRSIIFRREYPQLTEIARVLDDLTEGLARVNHSSLTWRFDGGRLIQLGAVALDRDVRKFQGRPHDLTGFDELAHFAEHQYRFLQAWNRTTTVGQRCRVIACGNPPSVHGEGAWIRKLWAPWLDRSFPCPAGSGELRWYVHDEGEDRWVDGPGEYEVRSGGRTRLVKARSRCFIRALVEDNPALLATDYVDTLDALPEPLRSQLRWGDYDAISDDDPWQIIPTRWILEAQRRWQEQKDPWRWGLECVGVDPARGGDDCTAIAGRRGPHRIDSVVAVPGRQTPDGRSVVREVLNYLGGAGAVVHIDPLAVGTSPLDLLAEMGLSVAGIDFSAAAKNWRGDPYTDRSGKLKMANLRAWAYWRLREMLDPVNGTGLELPPDQELLTELAAGRYLVTTAGIRVEPKDDIRERIGRSPDRADAVAMAFYPTPPALYLPEDEAERIRPGLRRHEQF